MLKQCGTCKHCAGFDFGPSPSPSPSGPEDGVNCASEAMVKVLDQECNWDFFQKEFEEYGHINLFRIEVLEEGADCACWEANE